MAIVPEEERVSIKNSEAGVTAVIPQVLNPACISWVQARPLDRRATERLSPPLKHPVYAISTRNNYYFPFTTYIVAEQPTDSILIHLPRS